MTDIHSLPILYCVTTEGLHGSSFGGEEDGRARPVLQLAHARLGSDELIHCFRGKSRSLVWWGSTPTLYNLNHSQVLCTRANSKGSSTHCFQVIQAIVLSHTRGLSSRRRSRFGADEFSHIDSVSYSPWLFRGCLLADARDTHPFWALFSCLCIAFSVFLLELCTVIRL